MANTVTVIIPTALRPQVDNHDSLDVEGGSVKEVLGSMTSQYPELAKRLFNAQNELNRFVNIYLNDEDIRFLDNLDTPVKNGDELSIVPAIAGGAKVTRKCWLTFESGRQNKPCLWRMSRKYQDVVFDIRQASVQKDIGIMAVLFDGEDDQIQGALDYLIELGVKVDPVEGGSLVAG